MATPEVNGHRRAAELELRLYNIVAKNLAVKEETADRAIGVLGEYNSLPKQTIGQIKERKKLIRQTAGELLQNPQDINIAAFVWKRHDSFYELVREESKTLIREKWESITPEQLAQLVRTYADNPQAGDFAEKVLTSYFDRPKTIRQRISAYYTFVSSVLDLVGEKEAFLEGMKIALYATDILPRDPSLIEQLTLLCLPSKEEEKGGLFQKLLIIESVTKQAISMSSQDFTEYFQGNENFVRINEKIKNEWYERKKRVTAERGSNEARIMSNQIVTAMNVFLNFLTEPLSEERKQSLKDIWPYNLAFDETDPLNQKFQRVFLQKDKIHER